jgi:signal transduction histidine kinase
LFFVEDDFGRIYLVHACGVDRIDPKTGEVLHYTEADGLVKGDIRSAIRGRTGDLWFLSNKGASRFQPAADVRLPAVQARITGLRVVGNAWPVSDLGETALGPLEFSARQNSITVDFGAIDYGAPSNLLYQYRLAGAAGDWSIPTANSSVTFANLSPGNYRFFVRTASPAAPNASMAMLQFTILPPVWQRWWFLLAAAMSVGLAGYALHRYRVSRLLELERVRTRIATDLHDDIGASLSQMAILSEVIGRRAAAGDFNLVQIHAQKIAGIARELVDSMSDIVWAINPAKEKFADLEQRMREFAGEVLVPRNIQLDFDATHTSSGLALGIEARREILLIFKEAIHNLVRHSGCSHARVCLELEDGHLILEIHDDGHGFGTASEEGNGLASMSRRAEALHGRLEFHSVPGEGTMLSLSVPFRAA